MKKVLLKVGASALALTLMTGCGTSNDEEPPADENPTMDQEERQDDMDRENDDRMDEDNFDEREEDMPRNNE